MILNIERLREITRGTEEITDHDGTTSFFRFTPEQAQKYRFHRTSISKQTPPRTFA